MTTSTKYRSDQNLRRVWRLEPGTSKSRRVGDRRAEVETRAWLGIVTDAILVCSGNAAMTCASSSPPRLSLYLLPVQRSRKPSHIPRRYDQPHLPLSL